MNLHNDNEFFFKLKTRIFEAAKFYNADNIYIGKEGDSISFYTKISEGTPLTHTFKCYENKLILRSTVKFEAPERNNPSKEIASFICCINNDYECGRFLYNCVTQEISFVQDSSILTVVKNDGIVEHMVRQSKYAYEEAICSLNNFFFNGDWNFDANIYPQKSFLTNDMFYVKVDLDR